MAGVLTGRLFFFAQTTIVSNLFEFGSDAFSRAHHEQQHPVPSSEVPVKVPLSPKDADHITTLPGLSYDPGFEQYSGYFTVHERHKRKIFYWYVESQGNPDEDPVLYWTNGGPGCSGLYGFGTEHGPFFISSVGILSENLFSWNKMANILYIEQPAGVGFSYSERQKDYQTGDDQAAADNYQVILSFLERFPERQSNDFYIASESYGGHYMPQLAIEILTRNKAGLINFMGIMVGNPYVDPFTNMKTQFQTWYNHGLVPWPLYKKYTEHCHDRNTYSNGRCQNYMEQMYEELGKGINPYGLDYPTCLEKKNAEYQHHKQFTADSTITTAGIGPPDNLQQTQEVAYSPQITQLMNHTAVANPPFLPQQDRYRPCADLDLEIYLNRLDVIQAIHANPKTLPWTSCSTSRLQYSKDDVLRPMVDLYKELLEIMNNGEDSDNNLKLLIYSGDDDSICSLAGTQAWIWDLGVSARGRDTWLPWKVHNQTAGFVTRFRMDNPNSSFLFVTVHGAGHEVPSYRPMEALELLKRYLNGKW